MAHTYAFQIDKLKNNFDNIITLKREISKVKKVVLDKLTQLKSVYNELVKSNSKKLFLFCLDSFYFQYKTFAMEMEHIDRFRALMNNRMYCDYYKLFQIIISHIKENRPDLDTTELEIKSFPVYKDLEPFQEYKVEDIKEIHSNILLVVNKMYALSISKEDNIEHYNERNHVGFSISNFLNTLGYENRILQEQINLYINYLSFFHISQKKQLNRLYNRMQDFYREVDENININKTFSIHDIADEDRLHRFYIIGEDVTIENILEDSELLMENTDKIIQRLEAISPELGESENNIVASVLEAGVTVTEIDETPV
uniref:Uncharacterized protein n=1 Tax=viral metagenome TaxID=1070528 RepID=A0A6C0H239_9ZZZZ